MRLIPRAATLAGLLTIVGVPGIDATPAHAQFLGFDSGLRMGVGTGLSGYGPGYYGSYGLRYGGYSLGYPGYTTIYSYGYPSYGSYYSYNNLYGYPGYVYGYPGYGSGYRSYSSGYRGYVPGYGGYGGLNPTNYLGFPGGSSTVSGYYMPGYGFIR